ncbi:MAG: hypothetical protein QXK77_05220, partial [Archaeoglobaceae archaeon]
CTMLLRCSSFRRGTRDLVCRSWRRWRAAYVRQLVPGESFESIRKAIQLYSDSQTKVFESFKKLIEQIEKQQDEIYNKMLEMTPKFETVKEENKKS